MGKPKSISIDNVEYIRADSVQKPVKGNRVIAVLDRGWIMVGNLSETDSGRLRLDNCYNLRKWMSGGFGGVTTDPTGSGVVLDKCEPVEFYERAVIKIVPISENWNA